MNDKDVVMIFPEEAVGSRAFPRDLGLFLNDSYRDKGVQLVTGETLVADNAKPLPVLGERTQLAVIFQRSKIDDRLVVQRKLSGGSTRRQQELVEGVDGAPIVSDTFDLQVECVGVSPKVQRYVSIDRATPDLF